MDTRVDPAQNRYCSRPWKQITFLSDGTAVCACIDAGKTNPLGNIYEQSFDEIWNGPAYVRTRRQIIEDIDAIPICRGCPNRIATPPRDPAGVDRLAKPRALYLESVAACNLVCPGCDRASIEGTRLRLKMDTVVMKRIIDALAPTLQYMEYHVGGENYIHKDSNEVVRYAKEMNDEVFILSSTNGHYFNTEDQRRSVVESGIDCLIFSIDGATPETYARYRVRGDFHRVLDNMRGVLEWRQRLGSKTPLVVWRYILFDWNDSDEEMDRARRMAKDIGVDFFTWHLNVAQDEFSSKKHFIGSERNAEISHELWDEVMVRYARHLPLDLRYEDY